MGNAVAAELPAASKASEEMRAHTGRPTGSRHKVTTASNIHAPGPLPDLHVTPADRHERPGPAPEAIQG